MAIITPQPGKPVEPNKEAKKQQTETTDKDLPKVHPTRTENGSGSSGREALTADVTAARSS
jgi:hypothetical protein